LNTSAFNLGQLVGSDELDRDRAEEILFAGAEQCGLVADSLTAVEATIKSGLEKGMAQPRTKPEGHHRNDGGRKPNGAADSQRQDHGASGAEPKEWPDPLPLVPPAEEPLQYPIDALPSTLRDACVADQTFGQQPMALVACSALAAASLAIQGLANVKRAPGLNGPIGLYVLVVAQSGERKTSADKQMSEAIRKWELDKKDAMKPEVDAARAKIAAFQAEKDGLLAKIKAQAGKHAKAEVADADQLRHDLELLETRGPVEPIVPDLFYEDVTPEKMAEDLALSWPSASLWSDEAGLVVGAGTAWAATASCAICR
jgi:hypothetical protein